MGDKSMDSKEVSRNTFSFMNCNVYFTTKDDQKKQKSSSKAKVQSAPMPNSNVSTDLFINQVKITMHIVNWSKQLLKVSLLFCDYFQSASSPLPKETLVYVKPKDLIYISRQNNTRK